MYADLRRQHGVITRAQARHAGLTDRQIDRLVAKRELIPMYRGVYRHAAQPITRMTRLSAAVHATGGVASFRSGAELWSLELGVRPPLEVTIDARRVRMAPGVRLHRSSQFALIDRSTRFGIPVTGVERTVLDCAYVLSPPALETLAESAIRRRATDWLGLRDVVVAQGRRGRNGTAGLRSLVDLRLGDPTVPLSDFSRRVVRLLVGAGVPRPLLEHRVFDADGRFLMQVDLAWPDRRCIVELDGLEHHFGRRDRERDIEKRARVRAEGWRMLEVSWAMYAEAPDDLITLVTRFLGIDVRPSPAAAEI